MKNKCKRYDCSLYRLSGTWPNPWVECDSYSSGICLKETPKVIE